MGRAGGKVLVDVAWLTAQPDHMAGPEKPLHKHSFSSLIDSDSLTLGHSSP